MTNTHINDRSRLDARYGMTLAGAAALAAGAGLAGGVAQHLDGLPGKIAVAGGVAAAAAALSLTISAMKTWSAARRPGAPLEPRARSIFQPLIPHTVRLALPAPAAPSAAKREEPKAQAKADKPRPEPQATVETERARLQSAGFSNAEISQILIARETAGNGARGGFGSGIATGVLNNLDAVVTHLRSLIPSFRVDLERLLEREASGAARTSAALSLGVKTAAMIVIGYFVYLEAVQFRASAYKSWAEACIERQKNAINFTPFNELLSNAGPERELEKECK